MGPCGGCAPKVPVMFRLVCFCNVQLFYRSTRRPGFIFPPLLAKTVGSWMSEADSHHHAAPVTHCTVRTALRREFSSANRAVCASRSLPMCKTEAAWYARLTLQLSTKVATLPLSSGSVIEK